MFGCHFSMCFLCTLTGQQFAIGSYPLLDKAVATINRIWYIPEHNDLQSLLKCMNDYHRKNKLQAVIFLFSSAV